MKIEDCRLKLPTAYCLLAIALCLLLIPSLAYPADPYVVDLRGGNKWGATPSTRYHLNVSGVTVALATVDGGSFIHSMGLGTTYDLSDPKYRGSIIEVIDSANVKVTGYVGHGGTGETLGGELVADPGFDNAGSWNVGTGWAVGGGVATATATNSEIYCTTTTNVTGQLYKEQGDLVVTIGSVYLRVRDYNGSVITTSGTRAYYYTAPVSGNIDISTYKATTFTGTVDNRSHKKVLTPTASGCSVSPTSALATSSWGQKETGFNPNSSTFTVKIYAPDTYINTAGTLVVTSPSTLGSSRVESDGVLLESGATNQILYSDDLSKIAFWSSLSNATLKLDTTADITGTTKAFGLVPNTAYNSHYIIAASSVTLIPGADCTFSACIKSGATTEASISLEWNGGSTERLTVDFVTLTASYATGGSSPYSITPLSNGWYRVGWKTKVAGNGQADVVLFAGSRVYGFYKGDGTSVYTYYGGVQFESSPVPTSIIPTSGVSTQRAEDSGVTWPMTAPVTAALGAGGQGMAIIDWTPKFAAANATTEFGLVTVNDVTVGLLHAGSSGVSCYDGTNYATVSLAYVKDVNYKLALVWGAGKMQLGYKTKGGTTWTWGTEVAYDGSFSPGANIVLGKGVELPMNIGKVGIWPEKFTRDYIQTINTDYPGYFLVLQEKDSRPSRVNPRNVNQGPRMVQ